MFRSPCPGRNISHQLLRSEACRGMQSFRNDRLRELIQHECNSNKLKPKNQYFDSIRNLKNVTEDSFSHLFI
ncbi:hypothetical protein BpHYR1_032985 [Brachionus plicatilis]|uniref:Uncharacterized protein n=1 Tax=Brachionus plicatilis TaxID=10195 RepID=A0A3M7RFN3_BRAPC|nr:hypothetical protein BpHYR1_032985 [Brachionus plicatilis]